MFLNRRMLVTISLSVVVLATNLWSGESIPWKHMMDLTHTLSGKFPIVPVPGLTFPFDQKPIASLAKNGVFAEEWHLIAHNGTHMDAPIHYVEGGRSMEAYDVHELIVPAIVIDIRDKAEKDPNAQLTVDDIQKWEKQYGQIPRKVAVFMYSGWDEKAVNDPTTFVGLDSEGATHFPTLSADAVNFFVKERDIIGVGVDTLSFDQVEHTQKAAVHKVLFKGNRWGIECVNNLGKIPPKGAIVFAGALKVEGASASPIRLIAVW
jgi:kynurenine formamidase